MFGGGAGIKTEDGVGTPGASFVRKLVDEDSGAWGTEWGSIEVESAVQLSLGREGRSDARSSKKVEGDHGLLEKLLVPEFQREGGVGATEDGDEAVLESSDGAFGVVSMAAGWGQLEIDVDRVKEILEDFGDFAVKSLILGLETTRG